MQKSPGVTGAFEEREKGFEPSTLALARRCSTTELFPHGLTPACYQPRPPGVKHQRECGVPARACLDATDCFAHWGDHPCTFDLRSSSPPFSSCSSVAAARAAAPTPA